MNILVFNAGSSTVKYRLIDAVAGTAWCGGIVERVGATCSKLFHWWQEDDSRSQASQESHSLDHDAALRHILEHLESLWSNGRLPQPQALAHRIVHGGERFSEPVVLDDSVIEGIAALQALAPLHNPPALALIRASRLRFPQLLQVAVFDTAFHNTLPEAAYRYAVPQRWYRDLGMRRYGFHGISHAFVAQRAAERLGRPLGELKLISLHLGNGASVAAIDGGRSVETSMGMTPLEGLVMGTRSGDVDVAGVLQVGQSLGLDLRQLERELTHESGLKGLCGETDMREILGRERAGDQAAALALAVYTHRLRKYIGAYTAILGGLDALIFTAGVGENAPAIRERVCADLGYLGIVLDKAANQAAMGYDADIHAPTARAATLVVCTDEERAMARQALRLLNNS